MFFQPQTFYLRASVIRRLLPPPFLPHCSALIVLIMISIVSINARSSSSSMRALDTWLNWSIRPGGIGLTPAQPISIADLRHARTQAHMRAYIQKHGEPAALRSATHFPFNFFQMISANFIPFESLWGKDEQICSSSWQTAVKVPPEVKVATDASGTGGRSPRPYQKNNYSARTAVF